jgi:hypothetical protein
MTANTTGARNTGAGVHALSKNTTGQSNAAVGVNAMFNNTTGSNNIALGASSGLNLTVGNNNIDIGNIGVAGESGTIRIGTQGTHTKAFVGGIFGSMVTGDAVVVSNTGQLGIVVSSARFKHDIRDMGEAGSKLLKLRPVTFRYNNDPTNAVQYGLVAEEVAKVYPDLVSYGSDGKVQSVHYHELVPMLLNEIQKLSAKVAEDEQRISALERTLTARDRKQKLAAALDR